MYFRGAVAGDMNGRLRRKEGNGRKRGYGRTDGTGEVGKREEERCVKVVIPQRLLSDRVSLILLYFFFFCLFLESLVFKFPLVFILVG